MSFMPDTRNTHEIKADKMTMNLYKAEYSRGFTKAGEGVVSHESHERVRPLARSSSGEGAASEEADTILFTCDAH